MLAAQIEATGAELVIPESLPAVTADHGLLAQLFTNLLSNALKFQAPGTRPRVEVSIARDDAAWDLRVSDNGIGIPEAELGKIFRAFYRLRSPRKTTSGSG